MRSYFCAAVLLAGSAAYAHHSMRGEYDLSKVLTIQGTVTKIEWMNPHARVYLDVKDVAGAAVNWELEFGSPNGLMRQGWGRNDIKLGDRVTVDVSPAKTPSAGVQLAMVLAITLADGRIMMGPTKDWDGQPFNK